MALVGQPRRKVGGAMVINAKVFTEAGTRVVLRLVCQSRLEADSLVEQAYPDHRAAFLIVDRSEEGAPC